MTKMKDFWNNRFAEEDFAYGVDPNDFFKQQIQQLKPGTLFLPAEGEGRNAVYAASLGWSVQAVDYSRSGRDKAMTLADRHEVHVEYTLANLGEYTPEQKTYDAAAIIFMHLPRSITPRVFQRVLEALKPGGRLILEVYAEEQLGRNSGGPKDLRVLYSEEQIRELLKSAHIEYLEKLEVPLAEGKYHQGKAMVIRAIATV